MFVLVSGGSCKLVLLFLCVCFGVLSNETLSDALREVVSLGAAGARERCSDNEAAATVSDLTMAVRSQGSDGPFGSNCTRTTNGHCGATQSEARSATNWRPGGADAERNCSLNSPSPNRTRQSENLWLKWPSDLLQVTYRFIGNLNQSPSGKLHPNKN